MSFEGSIRLLLNLKSLCDQVIENFLPADTMRVFRRYFTSGAAGTPGIVVLRSGDGDEGDYFDVHFAGGFLSGPSTEIIDLIESYASSLLDVREELIKWMASR